MAFCLKYVPYATWHVYLVEAQDEDEALYEKDGEPRGSFNTESRKDCELFGPLVTGIVKQNYFLRSHHNGLTSRNQGSRRWQSSKGLSGAWEAAINFQAIRAMM